MKSASFDNYWSNDVAKRSSLWKFRNRWQQHIQKMSSAFLSWGIDLGVLCERLFSDFSQRLWLVKRTFGPGFEEIVIILIVEKGFSLSHRYWRTDSGVPRQGIIVWRNRETNSLCSFAGIWSSFLFRNSWFVSLVFFFWQNGFQKYVLVVSNSISIWIKCNRFK